MSLKAVAFDPGITTGYAVGIIEDGAISIKSGQAKWRHLELWAQLQVSQPDYIIWETFEYRKRQTEGVELYPRELIGIFHLYVQFRQKLDGANSVIPFQQSPMQGKSYFTDNRLKADNLYVKGTPHAMDAVRHLCQWFTFGPGFQYNTKGVKPA